MDPKLDRPDTNPAGHTPGSPSGHVAALDAARALGALSVFCYHLSTEGVDFGPLAGLAAGGQRGVTIFFVLSGFLLYAPFVRGAVPVGGYLARRVLRIMPAYVFALVGVSILSGDDSFIRAPATFLLFMQNFDARLFLGFLGTSWTLQLEMTFYLLLPVIAAVLARLTGLDTGRHGFALCVAGVLSFIVWIPAPPIVGALFPLAFWAFVPGMVLAVVAVRRPDALAALATPAMMAVGTALIAISFAVDAHLTDVLAAIGTVFVIAGAVVFRPSGRLIRVLALAGSALSFPFYLWHLDVIRWLDGNGMSGWLMAGSAAIITAVIACVSYLLVERPGMRLAQRISRRLPEVRPHLLPVG